MQTHRAAANRQPHVNLLAGFGLDDAPPEGPGRTGPSRRATPARLRWVQRPPTHTHTQGTRETVIARQTSGVSVHGPRRRRAAARSWLSPAAEIRIIERRGVGRRWLRCGWGGRRSLCAATANHGPEQGRRLGSPDDEDHDDAPRTGPTTLVAAAEIRGPVASIGSCKPIEERSPNQEAHKSGANEPNNAPEPKFKPKNAQPKAAHRAHIIAKAGLDERTEG